MSDVQDRIERLRKAGRLRRRTRKQSPTPPAPSTAPPAAQESAPVSTVADLLELPGMEERDNSRGCFLQRTVHFELAHRQGQTRLDELLALPPQAPALAAADPALAGLDFRQVAFIDTETSGLAGGAGTIVFLTGVGFFKDEHYVVQQYFARTPAEEPACLQALAEQLAEVAGLVSFNGKAFDLPLLRSRFILAGIEPPTSALPHLDLLHPARRLWRARLGACHFGNLEVHILGHHRSGADVPSWLIPSLWFRYARGENNVGDMERVLYHNLEDIVSMAPLAHVLCGVFAGVVEPHPDDLLSLAHCYARQGAYAQAEAVYRQALAGQLSAATRLKALAGLATALKRQSGRQAAAPWWQAMIEAGAGDSVEPYIELAKYHEWETGDLAEAQRWTLAALALVETWPAGYEQKRHLEALAHRLQRLQGKLAKGR